MRKVQFDANPPQVLEITPLVEKPTGLVRMPEPSRGFDEDLVSPLKDTDKLIELLADGTIMGNKLKNEDDNSHQSIELIDPTHTFTKSPPVKTQSDTSKDLRPIPINLVFVIN